MRAGRGFRRAGPVSPNRVNRVGGQRAKGHAGALQPFNRRFAMQPGVIANDQAFGMGRQPFRRRFFGNMARFPMRDINLVANLQRIAAIGKHRRLTG